MFVDILDLLKNELDFGKYGDGVPAVFMDLSRIGIVRAAKAETNFNLMIDHLGFPMLDAEAAKRAAQLVVDQVELARDRITIDGQERLLALQEPLFHRMRDILKSE